MSPADLHSRGGDQALSRARLDRASFGLHLRGSRARKGRPMKMPEPVVRATCRARGYRHFRTAAEIVGAVILLSGGAAAATVAPSAASAPGTTIRGCANTTTGALRVLLKASAKCRKGTTPLSWNTALFGKKANKASPGSGGAQCTLGEIILTAGKTSTFGTLLADGQLLPISKNVALFSLLGTQYGGNGTTNFALPDLRKSAPNGLSYSICTAGVFP